MNKIKLGDWILLLVGLCYFLIFLFRELPFDNIIINSFPSFTGAFVFSSIFKRHYLKANKGRYLFNLNIAFVQIIMMLEEFYQHNNSSVYDINDIVGILSGALLAILIFEAE
jgi:hypothetical protein